MLKESEYITIFVSLPNGLIPQNLRESTVGLESIGRMGISPNGRLRYRHLFLDSIELANEFVEYLHGIFKKRKYKNDYKIEIMTRIGSPKMTVRYKKRDSDLVRIVLG